ncbi:MAG TPA: hypothetical protein VLC53_02545 [Myxococcota bacterium]|nr:hypothetical protein [Myxococcota bacterium]
MAWWVWLALLVMAALVGATAVAVQRPGRARDVTAWLGAVAFYVVLIAMFGDWARASLASGSRMGTIAFGTLAALFSIGLVIALVKTAGALRGRGPGQESATH